jgi:uncharacterized membrane protein (DUF2068 family)
MVNMSERRERLVVPIGILKLAKAVALAAIGIAAVVTRPWRMAATVERGLSWLGALPGRETLHVAATKLWSLDGSGARLLAAGTLAYAAVFAVEGVGLVLRKRWAEWLTVVVTASFIPIEIYELVSHASAGKVAALVLNVAIVAYLVRVRLRDQKRKASPPRTSVARSC